MFSSEEKSSEDAEDFLHSVPLFSCPQTFYEIVNINHENTKQGLQINSAISFFVFSIFRAFVITLFFLPEH